MTMTKETLEGIRRSLVMSPSLPGDQAAALLTEVLRLQAEVERLSALLRTSASGGGGGSRSSPSSGCTDATGPAPS
jgi:hypothetical protein